VSGRALFVKRSLWRAWSAAIGTAVAFVVRALLRGVGR
jgi:hypothetical protein